MHLSRDLFDCIIISAVSQAIEAGKRPMLKQLAVAIGETSIQRISERMARLRTAGLVPPVTPKQKRERRRRWDRINQAKTRARKKAAVGNGPLTGAAHNQRHEQNQPAEA